MLTPLLQTAAYVLSPDRQSVLLMHRDKCSGDIHHGRYMGLGGHVERGEDVVHGIRREVFEESGLHADAVVLRGTVLWSGFGADRQDALGFIFRVDAFRGEPHGGNEEGTLEWVRLTDFATVPMWPCDHEWLPMVFDDDPRQFHGVLTYRDFEMVSWRYQRV